MNKGEFISRVTAFLKETDARKPMRAQMHTFHISDDDGNHKDFIVKKVMKGILYNRDDVSVIVDACIKIIQEALMHGEAIDFHGFAKLGMHYHKLGNRTNPSTGEKLKIDGRYLPKLTAMSGLKKYVAIFQRALEDGTLTPLPPLPGSNAASGMDDDPDDDEDDGLYPDDDGAAEPVDEDTETDGD